MSELKPILNRENSWYLAVEWGLCEVWDRQKLLMQFYETFLSPKDSFKFSTLIKNLLSLPITKHPSAHSLHPLIKSTKGTSMFVTAIFFGSSIFIHFVCLSLSSLSSRWFYPHWMYVCLRLQAHCVVRQFSLHNKWKITEAR